MLGSRISMSSGVSWAVMRMFSGAMFGAAFRHLASIASWSSGPRCSQPPSMS